MLIARTAAAYSHRLHLLFLSLSCSTLVIRFLKDYLLTYPQALELCAAWLVRSVARALGSGQEDGCLRHGGSQDHL